MHIINCVVTVWRFVCASDQRNAKYTKICVSGFRDNPNVHTFFIFYRVVGMGASDSTISSGGVSKMLQIDK